MNALARIFASPQGIVFFVAVLFALVLGLINPAFFTPATLIDLARNGLVTGIFALGVMMVLASGGIDVSHTAIGAFAMYATMKIVLGIDLDLPIIAYFVIAAVIGAGLGLINGVLIGGLGLNTLIVTLGTLSFFRQSGAMPLSPIVFRRCIPRGVCFAVTAYHPSVRLHLLGCV